MRPPIVFVPAMRRAGVTLAELVVATGLAALVMTALLSLVDSTLSLWTKGETAREARESGASVLDVLAGDLRQLHASGEGDMIVDWQVFDLERDGQTERLWPRVRFMRDASPREVARVRRRRLVDLARQERDRKRAEAGDKAVIQPEALDESALLEAAGISRDEAALGLGGVQDTGASGLVEVLYAVLPEGTKGSDRFAGVLYRSEHLHAADSLPVLLGDDAFDRQGVPDLSLAREVARGVLWFQPLMATQLTTLGEKGWEQTAPPGAPATSWDAWRRGRPDVDVSTWNDPSPGMPRAGDRPALPRRVRIALEVQNKNERERAPTLVGTVDEATSTLEVTRGDRLLNRIGQFVLIAGEWVQVTQVFGDRISVKRGQRGTPARTLPADSAVLSGTTVYLDVPVPLHEDDWRLVPEEEDR